MHSKIVAAMRCRKISILRIAGASLLIISSAAIAENPYPFKAKLEKRADHIAAVAYNDGPARISAVVNVSSSNCRVDAASTLV